MNNNLTTIPIERIDLSILSIRGERVILDSSKLGRGGPRKLPLVFTEHGAIMAANVLNSQRAMRASVEVVRAFVRLRRIVASNEELARKLKRARKEIRSPIQDRLRRDSAINVAT